jgi:CRISPR-associated exonuclease Cas4
MDEALIPISELRQLHYCPRIPFFHLRLRLYGVQTHRMDEGHRIELNLLRLERRRTLAWYGLEEGSRSYHVPLVHSLLGLSGVCDMVLFSRRSVIPVEVKTTGDTTAVSHRDQLVAYALCLEEKLKRCIPFGILVYVDQKSDKRDQRVVRMTPYRRHRVMRLVERLRKIGSSDRLPTATSHRTRCNCCEFRRFCADVK